MKKIHIIILFIFSLTILSCITKDQDNIERNFLKYVKKEIGIDIPNYLSFKEDKSNSIGGDYSHTVTIEFDSLQFDSLVNQINNDNKGIHNNNMKWVRYQSGYKLEDYASNYRNKISFYINTKGRIFFYLNVQE